MSAQSAHLGHMFNAELPNRQRRKGSYQLVTRFMLNCLKIQKSKPVAPRKCSFSWKVWRKFLCNIFRNKMQNAWDDGLVPGASALASHCISVLSWLSAIEELYAKTFYVSANDWRDRGSWTDHVCIHHPTDTVIFLETYVLRCLPQVYKIP